MEKSIVFQGFIKLLKKYIIEKIEEESVKDVDELINDLNENIGYGSCMCDIKYFDSSILFRLVDLTDSEQIDALMKKLGITIFNDSYLPMKEVAMIAVMSDEVLDALNKQ